MTTERDFAEVLSAYRGTRPRPPRWRVSDTTRLLQAVVILDPSSPSKNKHTFFCLYEDAGTMQSYLMPHAAWGNHSGEKPPVPAEAFTNPPAAHSRWKLADSFVRVLANATHHKTGKHFVIYRSESTSVIWTCPIEVWSAAGFSRVAA